MYCWQQDNFWLNCFQIFAAIGQVLSECSLLSACSGFQHTRYCSGHTKACGQNSRRKMKSSKQSFPIMLTISQFFQKCTFWAAASRQACVFCADLLISSEPHIAIALVAVHDLHSKQSFAWSHYFLSWYIICKVHIAAMSVYVQCLCQKWVYTNIIKILAWSCGTLQLHIELTVQRF
jgi:hypothetical protein